ncbi:uncharacterized protein J3R85_007967 [Psidium guajava]|nr:uncharacterized protein J3R85_007967 [Psidium guajava]
MPKLSFDLDHASPGDETIGEPTEPGRPHEALFLVLPYLSLSGLIAVGEACTSLRDAVCDDVLPWLELVVDDPLSRRMRDEILIKITSKANGKLRTLGLSNCTKITNGGLQRVIEKNPLINKLHVPGCTGLTPEGVINAVKILSANGNILQSIKINGICNLQQQHFQVLKSYVQADSETLEHKCSINLGREGDCNVCPMDVGICPKCNEVRKVVICPTEMCKGKRDRRLSECRGCGSCIPRCIQCGACVALEDLDEAEAICADILCMSCWLQLPKCDFCNKPYCERHAEGRLNPLGPRGFVCELCTVYEEDDIDV